MIKWLFGVFSDSRKESILDYILIIAIISRSLQHGKQKFMTLCHKAISQGEVTNRVGSYVEKKWHSCDQVA